MASVTVPPAPPPEGPMGGSNSDFRPLGSGAQGPPSMLNALQGMVANVHTAAREQEKATKDILAMTERTALILGTTLDRAQTLLITGAAKGERTGAGLFAGGDEASSLGRLPGGAVSTAVPPGRTPPVDRVTTEPPPAAPERAERRSQRSPGTEVPESTPRASERPTAAPTTRVPDASEHRGGYPEVIAAMTEYLGSKGTRPAGVPTSLPGEGGNVEGALPEGSGRREYFPRTFQEGKRVNVGSLRQTAAANMNTRLAEMSQAQEQWYVDEATGMPARRMVPSGSPLISEDGDPGWRARAVGRAQNFTGAIAEGAPAGKAFASAAAGSPRLMTLAKGAGVVGAAYVGVNTALNFAESQREGNARFQQSIGGAAQDGFGERWRQNLFRLGNRGFMSGRDAETIYQGAAAQYGRDDDMRGRYQDSALTMRRTTGIDARDATRLLDMAAEEGIENLSALAKTIRDVGEAAVDAGMGAQEGRELFERNFRSMESMGQSTGRIHTAEAMTEMQLGLGREFQDLDFRGQQTLEYQMRQAQAVGMSTSDFQVEVAQGTPEASMLMTRSSNLVTQAALGGYMGGTAEIAVGRRIQAWQAANPDLDPSPDDYRQIALEAYRARELGDVNDLVLHFQHAGVDGVNPGNAPALFAQFVGGKLDPSKTYAGRQERMATAITDSSVDADGGRNNRVSRSGAEGVVTGNEAMESALDVLNLDEGQVKGQLEEHGRFNTSHKTRWGKDDRSMETQIQNVLANQAAGLGEVTGDTATWLSVGGEFYSRFAELGDDEAQFVVETEDGPVPVNAKDLVEHFGDQLQASPESIRIISSGQYHDHTVGEFLGLDQGDPNYKVTSADKSFDAKMTVEEAEDAVGKRAKEDTTRVAISMDPELLGILRLQVNGADYNQHYASGAAPPASHAVTPEGWMIAEDE